MSSLIRLVTVVLMLAAGSGAAPLVPRAVLKPTLGGVLIEAQLTNVRPGDALLGVWTAGARAQLLHCAPRCKAVTRVPLPGAVNLSERTPYRVVLGGRFAAGRRVGLIFSFASGLASVEATVGR